MDKAIISNWNEVVKPEDTVFHLGDFSMYGPKNKEKVRQLVRKLNGNIHLILGNHDRLKPFSYIDCGFVTVHTALELHGRKFVLGHDPAMAAVLEEGQILLCGHVHNLFVHTGIALNVGVDVWGFKPVSMNEINSYLMRSSHPPPETT